MHAGRSRRSFATGTAGAAAAIVLLQGRTGAAEFEMRCATTQPFEHPSSVRGKQMWDAVESESRGRLRVKFFPNSELGGDQALLTQLRVGALDFLQINPGILASVVPVANICYLGFTYRSADEGFRVLDGALGEYVRGEVESKGMHAMRTQWDSGMLQIVASLRPIRVPDDLHGFKIRVLATRIQSDLFRDLGASPTAVTLAEIYTALQTHVVDGSAGPLVTIAASRWFEVQKYLSMTNHAWSNEFILANGDVWKRLPPDLREIVERNNTKYGLLERRDTRLLNASLADKLTRQGMTINAVDQTPFRQSVRPYFEQWAAAFGATAWGLLETGLGRKLT